MKITDFLLEKRFLGHEAEIREVLVLKKKKRLLSTAFDSSIILWDINR